MPAEGREAPGRRDEWSAWIRSLKAPSMGLRMHAERARHARPEEARPARFDHAEPRFGFTAFPMC